MMMITDTLTALIELQEFDREIIQLKAEREQKPALLEAHRSEVQAVRDRAEAVKNEREAYRSQQRMLEGEVTDREQQIAKHGRQLNEVKSNKEFQALQVEIESEKAAKARVEDKIVEQLELIEGCNKRIAELEAEVARKQERLNEEEKEVASLVQELDQELAGLEERRGVLAEPISPETLEFYERLLYRLKGQALSAVDDQVCTGCYRTVPLNLVNNLHVAEDFVTCTSCGRILYLR